MKRTNPILRQTPNVTTAELHPRTMARRAAMRALIASEKSDFVPLDFFEVDASTRAFARELYSGTQRNRARLDWSLAPLLTKPIEKLDASVRAALRLGAYEHWELGTPPHGFVGEYAGLMRGEKLASATGFVNAILRRLPEQERALPKSIAFRLHVEHSHPLWIVERYVERLGAEATARLLHANNQRAPLHLRVNTRKTTREAALAILSQSKVEASPTRFSPVGIEVEAASPTALSGWNEGHFIAQDEAAQLVSIYALAGFTPSNEQFLAVDLASAPGGKATHLAQILGVSGRVVAGDSSPARLKLVQENAARLGLSNITTRPRDAQMLVKELEATGADLVLLDAPCSGTGTLRRRPDARWRKSAEQLQQLVGLQRDLLDQAACAVKVGGSLVYSTCSLEPEENLNQALEFETRHPEFERVPTPDELIKSRTEAGFLQTAPYTHGCDGMFAARWRRTR